MITGVKRPKKYIYINKTGKYTDKEMQGPSVTVPRYGLSRDRFPRRRVEFSRSRDDSLRENRRLALHYYIGSAVRMVYWNGTRPITLPSRFRFNRQSEKFYCEL